MFYLMLYTVGVFAVGFLLGVIVKLFIDKEAIRGIVAENRKLHRENWNLKKRDQVEIINISTEPTKPECHLFDPF